MCSLARFALPPDVLRYIGDSSKCDSKAERMSESLCSIGNHKPKEACKKYRPTSGTNKSRDGEDKDEYGYDERALLDLLWSFRFLVHIQDLNLSWQLDIYTSAVARLFLVLLVVEEAIVLLRFFSGIAILWILFAILRRF